jgi:hypothetical protein
MGEAQNNYSREWGRTEHVYQQFGIKRGTLYNLFADGKIEGREKRIRGQMKGIRLWNMDSIRRYIESPMDEHKKTPPENQAGCEGESDKSSVSLSA